ncbi:MAG: glycine--tRNA ligase, partial [Erysipelotrichaceae bacterium]|nr:glycine--tRNA ligase [Erysipelotrichaceae bacterium]
MNKFTFDEMINHFITSGFTYKSSEIYGGLQNAWDYGPLGVLLKNNLANLWYKKFVQESATNVLIDSTIIMAKKVWEATGHVTTFNDPLVDCRNCKSRFRADHLISISDPNLDTSKLSFEAMDEYLKEHHVKCPVCGKTDFTPIRRFNMMFKTNLGPLESNDNLVYLRPETAQGMFTNFKNVVRTTRKKLPLGICNIGKSFRNEITPNNYLFRVREFTQMEMEFFTKPGEDLKWFAYWKDFMMNFLKLSGIKETNLRIRDHSKEELSFYSVATSDIEYLFPFGWGELWGIADRTDYDLKKHMEYSKENLEYLDPDTKEKYVPYCIEPALGLDRYFLAVLCDAYDVETLENDSRVVLRLLPQLAPYQIAILPLQKQLNEKASEVFMMLSKYFAVTMDVTASIGKRYRRQDAIGTPYCLTVDFETLDDMSVTIRDRDSMKQIRLSI